MTTPQRFPSIASLALLGVVALSSSLHAQQARTYTLDADFDEGVLLNVNHDVVHDQLQLDAPNQPGPLPILCVAASGRGTMIRVDTNTGAILGEYRTAPEGLAGNPSRTAVDSLGNVWIGNRDESSQVGGTGPGRGSVVKIGVCLGGTRVDANGTPNPNGLYLKGPFTYNTCVDRNGDGLIRTSRGLLDILSWPNLTDGAGGADGIVQDATDEAILVYQRTSGVNVRHVSIDPNDDVWVGGYPSTFDRFDKLDGHTGAVLTSIPSPGCGGHGGIIDSHNVLWSTGESDGTVLRYDLNTSTATCISVPSNHGLGIDFLGNVWVCQFAFNSIFKIAPDGSVFPGFPKTTGGAVGDRTVCVTPIDNHVWVDGSAGSSVSRLDNDGNLLKVIDLGADGVSPRGLAVDRNGKVWVTCTISSTAKRIDPNGGPDGLGAVDLTVPLGRNALPYDYSDMTGIAPLTTLNAGGSWQVTYDSGAANTEYGRISWTGATPAGTSLAVQFRASDDPTALPSLAYQPAQNGVSFTGVFGRYVDVRVAFTRPANSTVTPVLFDLTIEPIGDQPPVTECPTAIRTPGSLLVFPEFDNRVGDLTLLSVTNTQAIGSDVRVEFVYIGRYGLSGEELPCLEFNRTHLMTPNDTLSVVTSAHNPNQSQGYVYVFAKDKTTGAAIVHNHLTGQAMAINGIDALSYSFDPYTFLGVGAEGSTTDDDSDGVRDLNNLEYSCVGDEILVPRFFGQDLNFVSQLVLVNLTGGKDFTATVNFLAYNDNEEVFSGQTNVTCWKKARLATISGIFNQEFLKSTNHATNEILGANVRETGWFRMDGLVASSPAASIADPAILAMLVELVGTHASSDLPFEQGSQENGDLVLTGIFADSTP